VPGVGTCGAAAGRAAAVVGEVVGRVATGPAGQQDTGAVVAAAGVAMQLLEVVAGGGLV